MKIYHRDGDTCRIAVIEIEDELATHYYILRGQVEAEICYGEAEHLRGALLPAEMTGRDDLAGVMEMLVFLEADGVVMAPWLRVLPLDYVDILNHATLLYVWRAGVTYPECAGVLPPQYEGLSKNHVATELGLTRDQSHQYALYLCYLVDCGQLSDLKVGLSDVLPLTIYTCDTNEPAETLTRLLEEATGTYPKQVERIWLRLRESDDFTVSSCSTSVLTRLRELFYSSMMLAILHNASEQVAGLHAAAELRWKMTEALRQSEFLGEYSQWDPLVMDGATGHIKRAVRLW